VMIKLVKDGIVEPLITRPWLLMNQRVILILVKSKLKKKKKVNTYHVRAQHKYI